MSEKTVISVDTAGGDKFLKQRANASNDLFWSVSPDQRELLFLGGDFREMLGFDPHAADTPGGFWHECVHVDRSVSKRMRLRETRVGQSWEHDEDVGIGEGQPPLRSFLRPVQLGPPAGDARA